MTLEDFKHDHMELVHGWAGDDHLEEFSLSLDSIIALAKQEERERIIARLTDEAFPHALCLPTSEDGDWEPVMEPEVREALTPRMTLQEIADFCNEISAI